MIEWFARRRREQHEERQAYLSALASMAESQVAQTRMVMTAVERITETQAKQLDAISAHLELFKSPGQPTAMSMAGTEGDRAWAEQSGFPFDGTHEEQSRWILEHDTDD